MLQLSPEAMPAAVPREIAAIRLKSGATVPAKPTRGPILSKNSPVIALTPAAETIGESMVEQMVALKI